MSDEVPTDRDLQVILQEIRQLAPEIARSVENLDDDHRQLFRQGYEKRVRRKRTWDPPNEDDRLIQAAAFALESAETAFKQKLGFLRPITTEPIRETRCFSLSTARHLCPTDAIVYRYIQEEQAALTRSYTASFNERDGRRWLPGYTAERIHQDLKCFTNSQTVLDAINRLNDAGLIMTERTGAFVAQSLKTNQKRDIAMWIHALTPLNASEESLSVDVTEARQEGLSIAMLKQLFRSEPETHSLPATDLAKRLPLTAETIRKLRKELPGE